MADPTQQQIQAEITRYFTERWQASGLDVTVAPDLSVGQLDPVWLISVSCAIPAQQQGGYSFTVAGGSTITITPQV
jgi:hypothetical protein